VPGLVVCMREFEKPSEAEATPVLQLHSTAEAVLKKCGFCGWGGTERPSAAKSRIYFAAICGPAEAVPFYKTRLQHHFSASSKVVPFQNIDSSRK
jgi:hypothetical protein